jgi:hypothetical protein
MDASARVSAQPGVVGEPGMCGSSLFGNREGAGQSVKITVQGVLVNAGEKMHRGYGTVI